MPTIVTCETINYSLNISLEKQNTSLKCMNNASINLNLIVLCAYWYDSNDTNTLDSIIVHLLGGGGGTHPGIGEGCATGDFQIGHMTIPLHILVLFISWSCSYPVYETLIYIYTVKSA